MAKGRMMKEFTTGSVMLPPVYHATESGFYGFLRTIPVGVRILILEGGQVSDSFAEIMNRNSIGKVVLTGS